MSTYAAILVPSPRTAILCCSPINLFAEKKETWPVQGQQHWPWGGGGMGDGGNLAESTQQTTEERHSLEKEGKAKT